MYYIGGIPGRRIFFFEKSFTPKVSQVAFLNIFPKFQKELLEKIQPHLSYLLESLISTRKYFSRTEISNHAACFDILVREKYFWVEICDFNKQLRCSQISSNTSFQIFEKILRNATCEAFGMSGFCEKKSHPGIPPIWYITEKLFLKNSHTCAKLPYNTQFGEFG